MGRKIINRTGEIGVNNFGSRMEIIEYRTNTDMDAYFPQYNYVVRNVQYDNFKKGLIKCPYEPRLFNNGYLGEGKYKVKENGKQTKVYSTWKNMLTRCYDNKCHEKYPTYKGCIVCEEWHNFQNFAEWYEENYYTVDNEKMHLDKDILIKHNKIYSPETCIFVPERINTLFTKCDKLRGGHYIGVDYHKASNKFRVRCSIYDFKNNKKKLEHLGLYNTQERAFEVYKEFKENYIKQVADYYKNLIPNKLYDALYNYKVEITD